MSGFSSASSPFFSFFSASQEFFCCVFNDSYGFSVSLSESRFRTRLAMVLFDFEESKIFSAVKSRPRLSGFSFFDDPDHIRLSFPGCTFHLEQKGFIYHLYGSMESFSRSRPLVFDITLSNRSSLLRADGFLRFLNRDYLFSPATSCAFRENGNIRRILPLSFTSGIANGRRVVFRSDLKGCLLFVDGQKQFLNIQDSGLRFSPCSDCAFRFQADEILFGSFSGSVPLPDGTYLAVSRLTGFIRKSVHH